MGFGAFDTPSTVPLEMVSFHTSAIARKLIVLAEEGGATVFDGYCNPQDGTLQGTVIQNGVRGGSFTLTGADSLLHPLQYTGSFTHPTFGREIPITVQLDDTSFTGSWTAAGQTEKITVKIGSGQPIVADNTVISEHMRMLALSSTGMVFDVAMSTTPNLANDCYWTLQMTPVTVPPASSDQAGDLWEVWSQPDPTGGGNRQLLTKLAAGAVVAVVDSSEEWHHLEGGGYVLRTDSRGTWVPHTAGTGVCTATATVSS